MGTRKTERQNQTPNRSGSKPKIAIIDDDQRWLKVFRRLFRNSKYAVDTYSDPQVFLDTITQSPQKYSGIICDIKMPDIDGYQVFDNLKSRPETENIPFLMVSGALTQDQNFTRVQGIAHISKLDDNLRVKVFKELIDVIENWPKVKKYLEAKHVTADKIDFFCQFFINYHKYFNEILKYVNRMEQACVKSDLIAMSRIKSECETYMHDLQTTCMDLIGLIQKDPETNGFIKKLCERGRTSLNMIQTFQFILGEEASSSVQFQTFLHDCRYSLEKIIIGTEQGYNLRETGS
jgi:CheY-like chemotaxis protein